MKKENQHYMQFTNVLKTFYYYLNQFARLSHMNCGQKFTRTMTIVNQKRFPKTINKHQEMTRLTQKIIQFNSEIWNRKKETISAITNKPLSLKDPIKMTNTAES